MSTLPVKIARRVFLQNSARLCLQLALSPLVLSSCRPVDTAGEGTGTPAVEDVGMPAVEDVGTQVAETVSTRAEFVPAYVNLHKTGELARRAEALWAIMESCQLCPRRCGVNRLGGDRGFCRAPGATLEVASYHPHFGEERPLVGSGGSGTIFLTHCNLRCIFCQNWEISHLGLGTEVSIADLARMMLELQEVGCHNINLVTPTHYSAHILKALVIAAGAGLRLPIVYNTSGWERLEILRVFDGVVDIYLPDFKYWESAMSAKYSSGAESYPEITAQAILEMHRQVGVARPPQDGIMRRGLMIRHLVMPNDVAGSEKIMEWIAAHLPRDTYINIMVQYTPLYKAYDYPDIARRVTEEEYVRVVRRAQELGLTNLDIQGYWWLR